MPQIKISVIKRRAKELRDKGDYHLRKTLKQAKNSIQNVLVESESGVGHCENFLTFSKLDKEL